MRKPIPQYLALSLLLLWALVAEISFAGHILYAMVVTGNNTPLPFLLHPYTNRIASLLPGYEHGPLQKGDEVLQVNGRPIEGREQIDRFVTELHPGEAVRITVRRPGEAGMAERSFSVK